ncbi:MAG: sigma-70 family RNA polymerase sigma factor [Steroidobacteraceae bacterium]
MRRIRVLGNESAGFPVILTVTPDNNFSHAIEAGPRAADLHLRRPDRIAVISQRRYGKPVHRGSSADLYMNDQVGGNLKRDRFHALCQALRPDLLRFAFWLSRDRALAEDVVQEAMLRAWKAQDSLLDEAAAKPWLLTIIRREYARSFERKRLVTVDIDDLIAREEPTLAAAQGDDLAELRAALFKLPEEYREPLVLQALMGYSTAEIAAELNLSNAAVLTRLFRGRNQLRAMCGEDTRMDPEES